MNLVTSQKNFEAVDLEDADVSYAAHLLGCEKFDIVSTTIVMNDWNVELTKVKEANKVLGEIVKKHLIIDPDWL